MLDCWSMEPEERPEFSKLHEIFDAFLSKQTQDKYPYMEVLSKPYYMNKVDNDEPEHPGSNQLNINITDVDSGERNIFKGANTVKKSASFNQLGNLKLVTSESNHSLQNTAQNTQRLGHTTFPRASFQHMQAELSQQIFWDAVSSGRQDTTGPCYVKSPQK